MCLSVSSIASDALRRSPKMLRVRLETHMLSAEFTIIELEKLRLVQ